MSIGLATYEYKSLVTDFIAHFMKPIRHSLEALFKLYITRGLKKDDDKIYGCKISINSYSTNFNIVIY